MNSHEPDPRPRSIRSRVLGIAVTAAGAGIGGISFAVFLGFRRGGQTVAIGGWSGVFDPEDGLFGAIIGTVVGAAIVDGALGIWQFVKAQLGR